MSYIPKDLRERVEEQAKHRCGYCLTAEAVVGVALEIDHLIPEALGGTSDEANLWLACSPCNAHKGDRVAAIDPMTDEIVPLFDPRRQAWAEHFAWVIIARVLWAKHLWVGQRFWRCGSIGPRWCLRASAE